MAAQPHPIAFVDESWLQQRGSPGAYLMAAVIIDQEDVPAAEAAASTAAGIHDSYHSTALYHRGHVGTIEAMLDVVAEHAGWSVVSAQVPLNAGTRDLPPPNPQHARAHLESQREHARQVSLERLLRYLDGQRVRDVYLETRASPTEWQQARDAGSRLPATDRNDIRAYRRLLDQGAISHRMRLIHVEGHNDPGLWMADSVAWSAGRAIRADEPQWWNRIADVATVIEATTGTELHLNERRAAPPDGERDPHNLSQGAQAMFPPTVYSASPEPHQTGTILQSLVAQADQARTPAADQLTREVLGYVQHIAERVEQLSKTVDRMLPRTAATTDTTPSQAATPRPRPDLHDEVQPANQPEIAE
ncbi:hypothetical protein DER29_5953 [Micromonospora sp. M71_S20]|uniref:hypothetical protein n=1 Tax=Micromonospora sp. M71_S20 TaxID=592872 RepID=UPI000EB23917|nr:hypothetical protein [Micromonospora sp. M71_S20]RLK12669.1 hypothetical protein DER29_5953 [Micromonospora sp. M71_S20]